MARFKLQIDDDAFEEGFEQLQLDARVKIVMMLELVAFDALAYLRSLTSATQPPVRASEGHRRAHPGGWADRTGNLANAYSFQITVGGLPIRWTEEGPTGTEENPAAPAPIVVKGGIPDRLPDGPIVLELRNSMDYAIHLENRDGYWVLSGLMEEGDEFRRALRRAAARYGMEIR